MNNTYQPICPLRRDAKCLGAMCALSVARDDDERITCALAGDGRNRAVIDRRGRGEDPVERT